MPRKVTLKEVLIVVALFALTNLVSALRQKPITYDAGLAWERDYYLVAAEFAGLGPIAAQAPFVYRLGTPWIVSRISPGNLVHGFKVLNITASFVASLLLLFWLGGFLEDWKIRVLLVTLFLIQWDAPPRIVYHRPVHCDTMYFVFVLVGLLAIRRYRAHPSHLLLGGLVVLSFVGAMFREIVMIVPVCFLAIHQPFACVGPPGDREIRVRMPPLRHWLPLLAGASGFLLAHSVAHSTNDYSFLATILDFLYTKPALGYLQAWFLAYGPVLFIIIYDWRKARAYLAENQHFLLFLATGAWLGFFGGTDTERLLYWSMPCMYILLGRAIGHHRPVLTRWPVALTFILGQAMTSRVLWTTPDYPTDYPHTFPILQQFGSHVQFLDLFSWDGFRYKELLSMAQFAIYGTVILWVMRRLERRRRFESGVAAQGLPPLPG